MNVALSSELLSLNLVSESLEKSAVELYLRNFGIELYKYLEGQYQIDATNTANEFCPQCPINYLKKTNLKLPYNSDTAHFDATRTILEELALLKSPQSTIKKELSGKKVVDNARDTLIIDNCEPEQLPNVIYALTDKLISRFPCLKLQKIDIKFKGDEVGFGCIATLFDIIDVDTGVIIGAFETQFQTTKGIEAKLKEEEPVITEDGNQANLFKRKCEIRDKITSLMGFDSLTGSDKKAKLNQIELMMIESWKEGNDAGNDFWNIVFADDSLDLDLSQRDTIIQLVNEFAIWHEQSEAVYSDNPCLVSNKEQQQLLQGQLTPELLSIWQDNITKNRRKQESLGFMKELRGRVEALRQQNNNGTRSKGFVGVSLQELRQLV